MSLSQTHRLRIGRFSEISRIYLLTTQTKDREPVFADWKLGRLVMQEFKREQESGATHSLAWVIMPDHFHWLVELKSGDLSSLMQRVKSRSTIFVNRASGRAGG